MLRFLGEKLKKEISNLGATLEHLVVEAESLCGGIDNYDF